MYISRVVTESELVARSEKLETSLDSGNHAGQGGNRRVIITKLRMFARSASKTNSSLNYEK